MPSLLAHLAAKFSDQNEVVATDALAFVLRQSSPAREGLQQLLGTVDGAAVSVAHVSPQYAAGEESRPDLATFSLDGALTAFIEAKFWAGLTDAQPVEYLRRLGERGGKVLSFVVPRERIDSIFVKLAERAREAGKPLEHQPPGEEVRTASAPNGLRVIVVSWKRLLSVLTTACRRAEDQHAVASLDQIAGLVERFELEGFGPMSQAELTDLTVPRRIRALSALVQALIEKGVADKFLSLEGTRPRHDWESAGRYLALPHGNAWLGTDHDAWARYHSTPLWLWFDATEWGRAQDVRRGLQAWEREEPPRMHVSEDDSVCVPLFIRAAAEQDDVVEDLLRQLKAVDQTLAAAGLSRSGGTPEPQQ